MESKKSKIKSIFKGGSKTYYYSSLFFPKNVRKDVSILYSFVRKADDFVDDVPQRVDEFYDFKGSYERALNGGSSGDIVIDSFIDLQERMGFDEGWIEAFLHSMELDIIKNRYETIEELKEYLYGSAEVIGLMMAKILDLPEGSYKSARYLGRAMQYINFIRDIEEDLYLNRQYFPLKDMKKFDLYSLEYEETHVKKDAFKAFVKEQVGRYYDWQDKAEAGFHYIPRRYLIPIKTASDMYKWTARGIMLNPNIVYYKKLKPSKFRIFNNGIRNVFYSRRRYGNIKS